MNERTRGSSNLSRWGGEALARVRTSNAGAAGVGAEVLSLRALVLNRSFVPVHFTSVRRACVMLYQGVVMAVDDSCRTFDFRTWTEEVSVGGRDSLGIVGRRIRAPRVVALTDFDRLPRRRVRFSRQNVFHRDHYTCQYCGRRLPRAELNLDHVVPRSQGGRSTWENIVCSCHPCNRRKGGRTPEQSGFRLLRRPTRPTWTPLLGAARGPIPADWTPFLPIATTSIWTAQSDPLA